MNIKKALVCVCMTTGLLSFGAIAAESPAKAKADTHKTGKPSVMPRQHVMTAEDRIENLREALDLSDDQVKAMQKIQNEAREKALEIRKNSANSDVATLLTLPPDSKEYDQVMKKAAKAASDMASDRIMNLAETRKKVYAELNAEQKIKYLEMSQARPGRPHQNMMPKAEKPAKKSAKQ